MTGNSCASIHVKDRNLVFLSRIESNQQSLGQLCCCSGNQLAVEDA